MSAIATATGLGGYNAAFLALATVSAIGLITFYALMPETPPNGVKHAAPKAATAASSAS